MICLSSSQIERFCKDNLPPEERASAEAHIEACARCREALYDREFQDLEIDEMPAGTRNPGEKLDSPAAVRLDHGNVAGQAGGETIGPYLLRRELGRGGQGRVYAAEDTRLGRRVALKVLPAHTMQSPEIRLRFEREAAALSRLDHPGICTVYETGEDRGTAYIAMRYIDGKTLARVISEETAADGQGHSRERVARMVSIIERAARALHAAHEAGLVHRDVKPGNIMITRDEDPVILDFGLVKDDGGTAVTLTRTGDLMGTPAYMSPEQVAPRGAAVDRRTDVYSLGVTLYEALTLHLPFDAPTVPEIYRRILADSPPRPGRYNRFISRDLSVVLEVAMEKDPRRRYQTALDLAEDLSRIQGQRTILARRTSTTERAWRLCRRNPAVSVLSALVLGLLAAVAIGSIVAAGRFRIRYEAAQTAIREALGEAGRRLAAARAAPQDDLGPWAQALAAAEKAESLAASTEVDPELSSRASSEISAVRAEESRARGAAEQHRADERMRARLESIPILGDAIAQAEDFVLGDEARRAREARRTDAAFEAAFRDYGIDVDRLGLEASAERVRASAIFRDLVSALDAWALTRRGLPEGRETQGTTWRQLLDIAGAADPDAWRRSLRGVLAEAAGGVEELRRLARKVDVSSLPAASLRVLGNAFTKAEAWNDAVAFLKTAQQAHPEDFVINLELAGAFERLSPPNWREAIRFHTVALALRPQNREQELRLAAAQRSSGDLLEAASTVSDILRRQPDYAAAHDFLGAIYQRRGQLDAAISSYREALRIRPETADAWFHVGEASQWRGELEDAIAAYRQVLALRSDFTSAYWNLAHALREAGECEEADCVLEACFEECRRNVERAPSSPDAWLYFGDSFSAKGDMEGAITAQREALRLHPENAVALHHLGMSLERAGLHEEAALAMREALRVRADGAFLWVDLATVLRSLGNFDEAVEACQEAARLEPDSAAVHDNLAHSLAGRGDMDQALEEYREAVRLSSGAGWCRRHLSAALRKFGRFDEAVDSAREALIQEPGQEDLQLDLARALWDRGDLEESIDVRREAVIRRPRDALLRMELAGALRFRGDLRESETEVREAVHLRPGWGQAHLHLAMTLRDEEKLSEALESYATAVKLEPRDAGIRHQYAILLRRVKRREEAIAECRESLRLRPESADARLELGDLLKETGRSGEAREAYDAALRAEREDLRRDPRSSSSYCHLSRALKGTGDPDGALVAAREAVRLAPRDADRRWDLARLLREKGNFDEALAECREAAALHPGAIMGFWETQETLERMGRSGEAVDVGREAVRCAPGLAAPRWRLGLSLSRAGRLDEAIDAYREAIHVRAELAAAHADLSAALLDKGEVEAALRESEEALRLERGSAWAHDRRGCALRALGRLEEAVVEHQQAVSLGPTAAGHRWELGVTLLRQHKSEAAIDVFQDAIRVDPSYLCPRVDAAEALRATGKRNEARQMFDDAVKVGEEVLRKLPSSASTHFWLARALKGQGNREAAVASFREAVRLNPASPWNHLELARALRESAEREPASRRVGLLDDAIRAYREVIRLRPHWEHVRADLARTFHERISRSKDAPAWNDEMLASAREAVRFRPDSVDDILDLARTLWLKGSFDEAIAEYRAALRLRPQLAEAHIEIGFACRRKWELPKQDEGEAAEAAASISEAICIKPALAWKGSDAAYFHVKEGDYNGAIRLYREGIRAWPEFSASNYAGLGNALRENGDLDEAEAAYREAIRRDPRDADIWYNLGLVHLREGRYLDTLGDWTTARDLDPEDACWAWCGGARFEDVQIALGEMGETPKSAAERLVLAKRCCETEEYAKAAALFRSAYQLDPGILRGAPPLSRKDAAVAAARAGSGLGRDATGLDLAARTAWRGQALDWLRTDIARSREVGFGSKNGAHDRLQRQLWLTLRDWRLKCIRDPAELSKLQADERGTWQALWAELRAICAQLSDPTAATQGP